VLILHYPVLVLVYKQKLCCSLARWLACGSCFFFFICLSVAVDCSASPTVRCGSSAVYYLSCFGVGLSLCLFTMGLCLCLTPFPWDKGKVSDPSASCCCQHIVIVHCLFFNAAEPFDSGCSGSELCSLLTSFLPYFRQLPITCLLAAPAICLLMVLMSSAPCPFPLFLCTFSNPHPLHCVLVFISLVYSVFLQVRISLSRGVVLFYPRGG
jgi:hypothetical protein